MGRICVVCLILAEIFAIQALAQNFETKELNPLRVEFQNVRRIAEEFVARAPEAETFMGSEGSQVAEAPSIRRMGKHHTDKSVAGGGMIIGGLVTAIFAAVFCYIRVTRRSNGIH